MMELHDRIKLAGFTPASFAKCVGVSRQTIQNYLSGKRVMPSDIDEQLNLLIRNRTPEIQTELERIDQVTDDEYS